MAMLLLEQSYPWFGKHAGFAPLRPQLLRSGCDAESVFPKTGFLARLLGKAYSTALGVAERDQQLAAAEFLFTMRLRCGLDRGHILFLENYLPILKSLKGSEKRYVATIHVPRSSWKEHELEVLARYSPRLIVLSDNFKTEFSDVVSPDNITVLRHGVDTEFFEPGTRHEPSPFAHFLYVGTWLRNVDMFVRLIQRISSAFPNARFDLVVPPPARQNPALRSLTSNSAVTWHQDLSDHELKALYQRAVAMLMPMNDGGANNAILEALASGVPVITTDVGGIRSYGGGTIYPVVPNNDDTACFELVGRLLSDSDERQRISSAIRDFAVRELDWKVVASRYLAAYQELGLVAR